PAGAVEVVVPRDPPGSQAQDVALAELDALRGRGRLEQLGQDLERRAWVDGRAARSQVAVDVEQHAASHDAVAGGGVDAEPAGPDLLLGAAVVEAGCVAEMADRVPLGRALREVV